MITYQSGSIFDSAAQCLINPVNCVGVMGAGLALDFKRHYPGMFEMYRAMCKEGSLSVGQIMFWTSTETKSPLICLFPTKQHFRDKSTVRIIDRSLSTFVEWATRMKSLETVAFPKIGCGLGGLNFEYQVRPLLEKHLAPAPFLSCIHL